jgi:3-oxoacyl-[acyl-carrier-protein] synthase-3
MALAAGRKALEAAKIDPKDVDLIVCATMTPDHSIPSTAALIERGLEAERAGGFDLGSACSGFVLSLSAASHYIKCGAAKNALVIGSEKMSTVIDFEDRTTAVLFADGAGAAVLVPDPEGKSDVLATRHGLKGDTEVLSVPAGGSRKPPTASTVANKEHFVKMKGRETFKFAVKTFSSLIDGTCADAGFKPSDLKCIVPHQVNQRIIEAACERSDIDISKCVINIERIGNTSAASVALALDEAVRSGRIERGDLVLLVAFGAGLSWGSALLRW